jgi:hypothetical protein
MGMPIHDPVVIVGIMISAGPMLHADRSRNDEASPWGFVAHVN